MVPHDKKLQKRSHFGGVVIFWGVGGGCWNPKRSLSLQLGATFRDLRYVREETFPLSRLQGSAPGKTLDTCAGGVQGGREGFKEPFQETQGKQYVWKDVPQGNVHKVAEQRTRGIASIAKDMARKTTPALSGTTGTRGTSPARLSEMLASLQLRRSLAKSPAMHQKKRKNACDDSSAESADAADSGEGVDDFWDESAPWEWTILGKSIVSHVRYGRICHVMPFAGQQSSSCSTACPQRRSWAILVELSRERSMQQQNRMTRCLLRQIKRLCFHTPPPPFARLRTKCLPSSLSSR